MNNIVEKTQLYYYINWKWKKRQWHSRPGLQTQAQELEMIRAVSHTTALRYAIKIQH